MKGFVKKILENQTSCAKECATAFAPSNIALCKYWGKRDPQLNLPLNSSLSISLGSLGTKTTLSACTKQKDEIWLNGTVQDTNSIFAKRISEFLDLFREHLNNSFFTVRTENNIPTAAGLASSASGFAALVLALNDWAGWNLSRRDLSMLARLGSGSATRSIFTGFVQWHAGHQADGMDSFAEPIDVVWPDFRIGILTISDQKKAVGSREGMNRTTNTSTLYKAWPSQVENDLKKLHKALRHRDFTRLGTTAEHNALAMHATMLAACPPLLYFQPETIKQIHRIHQLRTDGLALYFTIDAGPNLKLLFQKEQQSAVQSAFPELTVIAPFSENI